MSLGAGWLLAMFIFFVLPFILVIIYFWLFRYTWKKLSISNAASTITDFRWKYAIVSFFCMVIIIGCASWAVDAYIIYHQKTISTHNQIARENEKQRLINEKLRIQKPLAAQETPNFIATKAEDVIYKGETYPTIRIGGQRWFAKSLNVPTINYNDCKEYWDSKNCPLYGVYTWHEAINLPAGETPDGTKLVQGICPTGWHIPSHEEFLILETTLMPNCGPNRPIEYAEASFSCIPVGDMLKKEKNCFGQQNCNRSLFSMETSEYEQSHRTKFNLQGNEGYVWTSTKAPLYGSIITRGFSDLDAGIKIEAINTGDKGQVRCLQD